MSASFSYYTRSRVSHSTKSSTSTRPNTQAHLSLIDSEADLEEELEMLRIRAKEVAIETKLKKIKARKDVALTATGSNRDKDSVVSSRSHETGLRLDPTPLDAVQRTADYVIGQMPQQTVAEPVPWHGGEKEVVFNSSQISGGLSCPEICIKNNTQTNMDFNDHLMFDTEFEELCSDTLGIPDPSPCDDLINSDELSLSPTPLATTISSKKYEEEDEEADLLMKNQEMTEVIHSDHDYVQRSPSSFDSSSVSSPVTPQSVESVELIPNQSLNSISDGQGDEDDYQQIHLIEESVVLVEEEFTDDYSTINLNAISTSGPSIEVGSGGESISTHNAWVLDDNIIEAESPQSHKVIRLPPDKTVESFTIKHNTISNKNNNNVSLVLTEEEKTLPTRESYVLPTNMPLTKEGEQALKSVRRKIRNNVSAKESRKRRQEYVDGLEERVKLCSVKNPNSAHAETNKVILKPNASIQVVVSIQTRRGAFVWEPGGPELLPHLAIPTPIGNCT